MDPTTPFQTAYFLLLKTFYKYSSIEGDRNTLTKAEFKTLLDTEMPIVKDLGKKEAEEQDRQFKNLMLDLDHNADQKIDFMEFIAFVASIGMISYEDKE